MTYMYVHDLCYVGLVLQYGRGEDAFIQSGCCNWNDPDRALDGHQSSEYHREACLKLSLMQTITPVIQQLNHQHSEQMKENKENLLVVIKALAYLCRQGLATRGSTQAKKVTTLTANYV